MNLYRNFTDTQNENFCNHITAVQKMLSTEHFFWGAGEDVERLYNLGNMQQKAKCVIQEE